MCTLSFLRLRQGYSLMLNRDEAPARPPATELVGLTGSDGALRALFPLDPPSQGSFMGVNRAGAAFALLNQHPGGYVRPAGALSRGRLLPLALAAGSAAAGLERVAAEDLSATPPFLLLGVDEDAEPLSLRWDGRDLQRRMHEDGALQLASSSRPGDPALAARRRAFDRLLESLDPGDEAGVLAAQQAYHLSTDPQPGPLSVWMTRADVRSVSLTQALVVPGRVILRHWLREDLESGREARQQSLKRDTL